MKGAKLGLGFSFSSGGGGGGGASYLDSVIASVCCDLDATQSDSYGGSGQTWANLIASPADSAAQTDYDFWLGEAGTSDGDEPVFTGSSGNSDAYFAMADGDHFKIKANTSLINEMHDQGSQSWWVAMCHRYQGTNLVSIWSTGGNAAGTNGVECLANENASATNVNFTRDGTRTSNALSTGTYADGSDYVTIVSYDAVTDDIRVWHNSTTAVIDTDAGADGGANTDAGADMRIGCRPTLVSDFDSGGRVYSWALGNEYLDDTKAAAIIAHLEARHGRDYTP